MDAERWERLQALFHEAADLAQPDRKAFLDRCAAEQPELIDELGAMLEEDASASSILDRGLAGSAGNVFGRSEGPLPGELGAYRIVRLLGEGGMGVVYLAERADLGSRAAIKLLPDAWLSPSRRERFAVEQRVLARLEHPAIARLYDAGTLADGTPWFVMEYVEGVPITEHCARTGASVRERLAIFRSVCDAVRHAHQRLVVHRDLKPSNVLVRADGTAKLLDFGIARQLEDADSKADATRTGLRLMTPAYASPEQLRGEPVGVHTDVYSLGVLLYELLADRLPFDGAGRSPSELEQLILHRDPEQPSVQAARAGLAARANRGQWADLDVLCMTAMHREPERRYASADALIRDVDHFLAGRPLEARPESARYRVGKFVRRHRRPVAATAATILLTTTLGIVYTVRLAEARNVAVAEAERTQRIQRFTMSLLAGGEEEAGPADSLRVLTLVDRGLAEARTLAADPAAQTDLIRTLGEVYHRLGRLERADSLLGEALERTRARVGPDHPDVARELVALGLLRNSQARYDEAEAMVREALAIDRRGLPADHPALAEATAALADVLTERGEYEPAIAVLEELIRMRAGPAETVEQASALNQLADVQFYAGRYDVADSLNRVVLEMNRRLHGPRHPRVADVLINLGAIQQDRGDYVEAERLHREALAINRAWYGPEHPETAGGLTFVARALVFQERLEEAEELLRESLAVRERVYGPVHPAVASTVNEVGNVALRRERYDAAEEAFQRMRDIYRAVYGGEHYLMGIATSNLGSVHMARGTYATAESLVREAIAIFDATLGPEHLNTGIARVKLGRTLLRAGRVQDAERESRAGYDIVSRQASPSASWLNNARTDLVAELEALGRGGEAERFRTELANAAAGGSP
jgi:serine/threonine-protein kinase